MVGVKKVDVLIIGGGMIVHDQILPSLYHLQRLGQVGRILICARHSTPLKNLAESPFIKEAFPNQSFEAFPPLKTPENEYYPELYKEVIKKLSPRQCIFIALPDNLHYPAIMEALSNNQHVICVKPLVQSYAQLAEIEKIAKSKGLFVGVEYHKRFDIRALLARRNYKAGLFGEFVIGEAKMIEPYYYRHSNFQNWFTCDISDPFTYVGCHYVDLVTFITGLKPVSVSVVGIKKNFPNGKEGYMWSQGRVVYENGGILSLINGLGYPDIGGGSNQQGLEMFFEGKDCTATLRHDDQFRGVTYALREDLGEPKKKFYLVNTDYFRMVPWNGEGLKPVGYGYTSIEELINVVLRLENCSELEAQLNLLNEIDRNGIIATPTNSYYNELINECARKSIASGGKIYQVDYASEPPKIIEG
ncbi:MAG: Gfo/Idh/MocA family oxidoreductase [Candidatus Hydrogenedentes bacterium]|nr:Gfo/Idh/MocA family oxidoreductase [Candidatus Hydrogenedentota bacterium]